MNNLVKHKVTVVGLGHCGGRIVEALAGISGQQSLSITAIDTDEHDLNQLHGVAKIQVGKVRKAGYGCGGNSTNGAVAIADDGLQDIRALTKGSDVVLVVAGLGKGFASGSVLSFAQMMRDFEIPAIYFITTPLSLEGGGCQANADLALGKLKELSRTTISVDQNSVYTLLPAEAGINKVMRTADQVMGKGLSALIEILTGGAGDVLSIDFTRVLDMLTKNWTSCSIAFSETTTQDYSNLVQDFMSSPISGGEEGITNADEMIIKLTGPSSTPVSKLKFCLDKLLEKIGDRVHVTSGFNTSSSAAGVRLSGLIINYTGTKKKNSTPSGGEPHGLIQDELDLVVESRGRFSGTTRILSKKDSQDLDVPTFRRQNIVIEQGNQS